jgi:hypothetical protein
VSAEVVWASLEHESHCCECEVVWASVEHESHCCECRGERWCGLPLSMRVTVVSAEVRGGVGFP